MIGKDAKFCGKCRYSGKCMNEVVCEYIDIMGKPRGCPVGVECTKFEPAKHRKQRPIKIQPITTARRAGDAK